MRQGRGMKERRTERERERGRETGYTFEFENGEEGATNQGL